MLHPCVNAVGPPAGTRDLLDDIDPLSIAGEESGGEELGGAAARDAWREQERRRRGRYTCPAQSPPPILASRGLTGTLEDVARGITSAVSGDPTENSGISSGSVIDTSNLPANAVLLNVYDVSETELLQKINRVFTANNRVLVGGVFHAGVEVYGKEWGYGATEDDRTGVGAVLPRLHPQHTYRATVPMGTTGLSSDEVHAVLCNLALTWRGPAYNLIHNNCCSFCNALLAELGLRRIPGWVDRAARTASSLDQAVQVARSITAEDVQNHASETLETLRRDSAKVIDHLTSKPLFDEAQVQEVQAKAVEIGARAQALGASLWQWGQDIGSGGGGNDQNREALDIVGTKAQAFKASLWEWGQEVQKTAQLGLGLESETAANQFAPATQGRADELQACGTAGMIRRRREDKLLSQGLLDDDDEDELIAYNPNNFRSGVAPRKGAPAALNNRPQIQEAPAEWMSMVSSNDNLSESRARSAPAPAEPLDLLSGDLAPPITTTSTESSLQGNQAWTATDLLS